MSNVGLSPSQIEVREGVAAVCKRFPDEFWMDKDRKAEYAPELHRAMADAGFLGICMPEELGGSNLGIAEAAIMLLAIAESGAGIAGAQTLHASIYATVPLWKFGTEEQKSRYLPGIIDGTTKVCFGVTEPDSGLDTLNLRTQAVKVEDGTKYVVNGQKVWITHAQHASRMILLARTSPISTTSGSSSKGLSLFCADLLEGARSGAVTVTPLSKMGGKAIDANQVFMSGWEVPKEDLVGVEGEGFKTILYGMNAERCLLAGEALGLGYAALRRAVEYANTRHVFGRPIGMNQGLQHPLAQNWCELEGAKMLLLQAAQGFDRVFGRGEGGAMEREEVGGLCNAAKYLAAEAAHKACDQAILTHGGMGYSTELYAYRYLRESYVPRLAPVSREMVLNYIGQRILGLPKSY
ncbi:acyl-CoA dehydrogenase NM domain-like protein [Atractiella rhizophila]|nr:acyl-CoA dehydrogenase NM domain-like protein [Atractiella rhizophila]